MTRSAATRALGVIGAVAALSSACTVGPDYERPALTPPAAIRGAEGAPAGPVAGRCRVERRVPGRRAAGADPDGARAATPTSASRRRACCRRRPSSASPAPTPTPPSTARCRRRRRPDRRHGYGGGAHRRRARRRRVGPLGDRFLGQVPARHRSRARAAAGQRMGPARGRVQRRERGRAGLLRAALARSAAGDRAAHADLAPGVAGADAGARARRRHLARRRPRGGAAGLRGRRDDRRARAPHRAAGEPDLGPDRRLPVVGDAGPRAGRAAAAAGRPRRPAVRPAGAPARHPAGRAGADRRQRADRRGARRLLPEHRAHRRRRPPEHGAADADQHGRGCLDGGRRRRPADRHRRAHASRRWRWRRHGPRRRR